MVNYVEGLKRPFSDWKKFAIGVVLSMIPIVNLLSIGYAIKAATPVLKSNKKKYALPEWGDWWNTFLTGLKVGIIALIYMIPVLILSIYLASKIGLFEQVIPSAELLLTQLITDYLGVTALIFIIGLLISILLPMAILNFAKKGNMGAAFDFSTVFSKISGKYLIVWFVAMVTGGILNGIFGALSEFAMGIPFLPGVFTSIASFWMLLTTYTWFAEAYSGR